MGQTSVYKLPFPDDSDAPNGALQIEDLATDLDVLKWTSRSLKPTAGAKTASEDLTLTGSYQDVVLAGSDLVITPAVESRLLLIATFDFRLLLGEEFKQGEGIGTVRLDSTDQTPVARCGIDSVSGTVAKNLGLTQVVSQVYSLTLSAAEHTIKMRAKRGASVPGAQLEADNTRLMYLLFA